MRVHHIKDIAAPKGPTSRSTLYAHAAQGLITFRKIGGRTVVTDADYRHYLAGRPVVHRSKAA